MPLLRPDTTTQITSQASTILRYTDHAARVASYIATSSTESPIYSADSITSPTESPIYSADSDTYSTEYPIYPIYSENISTSSTDDSPTYTADSDTYSTESPIYSADTVATTYNADTTTGSEYYAANSTMSVINSADTITYAADSDISMPPHAEYHSLYIAAFKMLQNGKDTSDIALNTTDFTTLIGSESPSYTTLLCSTPTRRDSVDAPYFSQNPLSTDIAISRNPHTRYLADTTMSIRPSHGEYSSEAAVLGFSADTAKLNLRCPGRFTSDVAMVPYLPNEGRIHYIYENPTELISQKSPTSPDLKLVLQNSKLLSNRKCRICGDTSKCQHYGVMSCEGCKGFFKVSTVY